MGVVILIMALSWFFGSAEEASRKNKKSQKKRSYGHSTRAWQYYRETGMWPNWD